MQAVGKVTAVSSKPAKGFTVHSEGPPPTDTIFAPVDADDLTVASAAYAKGGIVEITYTGTPPTATITSMVAR